MTEQNNQDENKKNEKQIKVDIDQDVANGTYANLSISNFSAEEFIFDYIFLQPHVDKGKILSRIIMSPQNAKRFSEMLNKNITEYEKKFGPIGKSNKFPGINLSVN